jgi:hypothetical protein
MTRSVVRGGNKVDSVEPKVEFSDCIRRQGGGLTVREYLQARRQKIDLEDTTEILQCAFLPLLL